MSGCLPSPQESQTRDLLDELVQARTTLARQTAVADGCLHVGDVETRLYGEPGLASVQPAWSHLADAAHALQAVCGQLTLVSEPATDSAAQSRWQQGIQRELGVACDHLRAAGAALDHEVVC